MIVIPLATAVRDPKLLGGFPWTDPQFEILDSFGGPERRHLLQLGRQSGKDEMTGALAVHTATLRPDLDLVLPPGTTRDILVCCPRQDQAQEFVATAAKHLELSPLLAGGATVLSDRILWEFEGTGPDGRSFIAKVRLLALPANARTTRGLRACLVIYNEQAHLDDAGGPGSAEALWRALTPSLRAFGSLGRVVCASTPNGTSGKFADLVRQAENGWESTRLHVRATWEMVPVTDEEKREWRDELGVTWFEQEYGAQRVEGLGAFFDLTEVPWTDGPALPEQGEDWTFFLDPATIRDRFAFAAVCRSAEDPDVLLLGPCGSFETGGSGLVDIDREVASFKGNLERVWAEVSPYLGHRPRIVTDTAKAQAVTSYLGRKGVEVEVQSLQGRDRLSAFIATKTRIADESLRLWHCPDLVEDLASVQMRDSETIHLPRIRGRHCDTAAALVGAVWCLQSTGELPAAVQTVTTLSAYASGGMFG